MPPARKTPAGDNTHYVHSERLLQVVANVIDGANVAPGVVNFVSGNVHIGLGVDHPLIGLQRKGRLRPSAVLGMAIPESEVGLLAWTAGIGSPVAHETFVRLVGIIVPAVSAAAACADSGSAGPADVDIGVIPGDLANGDGIGRAG